LVHRYYRFRPRQAFVAVIDRQEMHQAVASDSLARSSSASAVTVSQLSSDKLKGLSGMLSSEAALYASGICAALRISRNSGSEILLCSKRSRTWASNGLPEPFWTGSRVG